MDLPLDRLIEQETLYLGMLATTVKTPDAWYLTAPALADWGDANRALRLRDTGRGPEAVAREVIGSLHSRGMRVVVDIDPVAEAQGIGRAIRRMGLMPVMGTWLLMRYAQDAPPRLPERGIEIVAVANETGLGEAKAWVEVLMSEEQDPDTVAMWREVAEREAAYPPCRLYLACLDGLPVGACDLFTAAGCGRIDSVVVRPEFRRRGIASVLTARAVADSLAAGNTLTYLYTDGGGAGEAVYRKLGFTVWEVDLMRRHLAVAD
jgi:GNAT superfamily N-acetyltransferase